ncbi:MAG: hypothetical protein ABSD57_00085 [Verrucomicrobiota bacterium]|jgi:hypothetical protein
MNALAILTLLSTACLWTNGAQAQIELLPDKEPQCVFAGNARPITVVWYNACDKTMDAEIRTRLYQTSSATVAPLSEQSWKKITILPKQTVLESAQVDFPAVKAETRFLLQWLEGSNRVIGKTEVLVYPTNLLAELKTLMGENVLGVFDPNNELKPLLQQNHMEFSDLGEAALEDFRGKLAVIGPFLSKTQMREGLAQAVQRIAWKGAAVVWIQPPSEPKDKIKPSFYIVPEGKGAVVVVQSDLVAGLSENPRSQLNLIYFSKLALNPESFPLPDLKTQP